MLMDEIIIRKALIRDAKIMASLDIICFSDPWSVDSFIQELAENKVAHYIVSEVEGKVIGYVGVWIIAGEGHITNVAVHPKYRRNKIGEKMILNMLKLSEESNVTIHSLEVRKSNSAAIKLYKKMNFFEAGLRKNYYANNGEDAIIMNRESKE